MATMAEGLTRRDRATFERTSNVGAAVLQRVVQLRHRAEIVVEADEGTPAWLEVAFARLNRLTELQPRWGSQHTELMKADAVMAAAKVLVAVLAYEPLMPSIDLRDSGDLSLRWKGERTELDLTISPAGQMSAVIRSEEGLRRDAGITIPQVLQLVARARPVALLETLKDIDDLFGHATEDTPTTHAYETARRVLVETQAIAPFDLVASTVEDFEGDLLIHWDAPSRSVVLVCPSTPEKDPRIYREDRRERLPESALETASAETISKALEWVQQ